MSDGPSRRCANASCGFGGIVVRTALTACIGCGTELSAVVITTDGLFDALRRACPGIFD